MERTCPTCGSVLADDPLAAEIDRLRLECRSAGIQIAPDDTIAEKAAEALLPQSARTIEAWRYRGNPLGSEKVGGRWRVSLRKFAAWRLAR